MFAGTFVTRHSNQKAIIFIKKPRMNRPFTRGCVVPKAGLEPAQPDGRGILSPLRLPVPPFRHTQAMVGPG